MAVSSYSVWRPRVTGSEVTVCGHLSLRVPSLRRLPGAGGIVVRRRISHGVLPLRARVHGRPGQFDPDVKCHGSPVTFTSTEPQQEQHTHRDLKTGGAPDLPHGVVFAISPNSASCERVFALLKNLFGEPQMNAIADYVEASLKLNYNGRVVG